MLIYPQFNKDIRSKHTVHLIKNIKELSTLDLSKKQESYFAKVLKESKTATVNSYGKFQAVIIYGKLKDSVEREAIRKFGAKVFGEISNSCDDVQVEGDSVEAIELFLEGLSLSTYSFEKYKSEKKKQKLSKIYTSSSRVKLDQLNHLIDATCWARTLVNEPVSFLTAPQLSKEIQEKCASTDVKVEVFEKAKIEALKMGGLIAVNKGSVDPPTFTILEYKPKNAKNKKPIILVGKGIVYDTGGLSLKPTANSMDLMKSDMGGAATMAATTYAAAQSKIPLHIITLIPSTDNRPGGNAYAPGDVITMFNGMTVEVLNTDAEGRMVLADALSYANKYKPELVIDAATLTGAAIRAIGTFASCVMGTAKQEDFETLNEAGMQSYDRVVQLPFWDDYKEELKSPIADIKNLGGPYAGMITAGKFLENFTSYPYIHIDIAGPSFAMSKDSYRGQGGTGAGVRLLVEFLKRKAK